MNILTQQAPSLDVLTSTLTTRGDIIRRGASAPERVALGTSGYALKSDGTDAVWAASREVLTASRTYYVRTDGSDSNNGLADSSGGAFLTLQKAIDTVYGLDLNGNNVTISVADGTYTAGIDMSTPWTGEGTVTLQGNTTTPANCVISTTSATALRMRTFSRLTITGFKIVVTTSGRGIWCDGQALLNVGVMDFGACPGVHAFAEQGAIIVFGSNYSITGSAATHWYAQNHGIIYCISLTITLTGTPAFSTNFAALYNAGLMQVNGNTFSGSATGVRYNCWQNSVLNVGGAGSTYLPGNSAGSSGTGGQYI